MAGHSPGVRELKVGEVEDPLAVCAVVIVHKLLQLHLAVLLATLETGGHSFLPETLISLDLYTYYLSGFAPALLMLFLRLIKPSSFLFLVGPTFIGIRPQLLSLLNSQSQDNFLYFYSY